LQGATSPQEIGKVIAAARSRMEAALADLRKHLRFFRQYRKTEKELAKQKKRPERS